MAKPMADPKLCPACEKYKPRSEYYKRNDFGNAVSSWCIECSRKSDKDWYQKNRNRSLKYSKNYRKQNREQTNASSARWRKENPQRKRNSEHKRRTSKLNNGVYAISPKDMRKLAGPCAYCGSTEKITMDHVIPISRGGSHGIGNLVPACSRCNNRKLDKFVMEWRMGKARPYKG